MYTEHIYSSHNMNNFCKYLKKWILQFKFGKQKISVFYRFKIIPWRGGGVQSIKKLVMGA